MNEKSHRFVCFVLHSMTFFLQRLPNSLFSAHNIIFKHIQNVHKKKTKEDCLIIQFQSNRHLLLSLRLSRQSRVAKVSGRHAQVEMLYEKKCQAIQKKKRRRLRTHRDIRVECQKKRVKPI